MTERWERHPQQNLAEVAAETRYDTPTGEHPDLIRLREIEATAVAQGYKTGDVNHYTQPIIGMLRLRQRDAKSLSDDDLTYAIEQLTKACLAERAFLLLREES